jgi:hypothetical protein
LPIRVYQSRIASFTPALVALALVALALSTSSCSSSIPRSGAPASVAPSQRVAADQPQVNLLAMGDWGSGRPAQRMVARGMGEYAAAMKPPLDGVLLAGDNFYEPADPATYRVLFEEMYGPELAVPFYAVLGNHDYQYGNERIELAYGRNNPQSRWRMPARWYRLELPERDPLVTVLMVDTNYRRMPLSTWRREQRWLREELRRPRESKWLVVCGHHPLFSNGDHGDDRTLRSEWGRLLEDAGVDFYVCGHDHDLQHLKVKGRSTEFVVCGGGGAAVRRLDRTDRGPFAQATHGFVHFRFGADAADVSYVAVDGASPFGRVAHSFSNVPRAAR